MEVLERLNKALKLAGHKIGYSKKSEIAEFLGYKLPYYSGIINGKEKLSEDFLKRISDYLGIDAEWVKTGEGNMMLGTNASTVAREDDCEQRHGQTVPYFMYQDLLQKYEAVVRENESLRNKLDCLS